MPSHPGKHSIASPLVVTVAVVLALRIIGGIVEYPRFWSMDMLRYVDLSLALLACIAAAGFLLPSTEKLLRRVAAFVAGERSAAVFWAVVAIFGALCVLFPMRTFFYGDGGSYVPEIFKLGRDPGYFSELLWSVRSAPLAGVMVVFITRTLPHVLHALGMALPQTSVFPFHVLSILWLGVFAVGIRLLAKREERVTLLVLLLGSGASLHFFGYVELYIPVLVSLALFFLAGLRALETGRKWPAVLLYLLACAAHVYTIALLPALLYVLLYNTRFHPGFLRSTRGLLLSSLCVLLAGIVVYFASGLWNQDGRIVMSAVSIPRPAGVQSYTLLSAAHLLDLVNLPLLLSPVSTVFLLVVAARRRHAAEEASPAVHFLLLALISFGVFLAFANAVFGWARDWDLAAPLGIIISLLAYVVAIRMKPASPALPATLALVSLVFVAPWIVMNVSEESSTRRFERIIELDAENMYADYALSGFEALRKHYLHEADYANEMRIEKRMVERLGYAEHYRLLINSAGVLADTKSPRAASEYLWVLRRLLGQAEILQRKGLRGDYAITFPRIDSLATACAYQAYLRKAHDGLAETIEVLAARHGLGTARDVLQGMEAFTAARYDDAQRLLSAGAAKGFETGKLAALQCGALLMLGRGADAESKYREAVLKYPSEGELRFLMGYGYLTLGDRRGIALLKEAEGMNPTEDMRRQIAEILRQIK